MTVTRKFSPKQRLDDGKNPNIGMLNNGGAGSKEAYFKGDHFLTKYNALAVGTISGLIVVTFKFAWSLDEISFS